MWANYLFENRLIYYFRKKHIRLNWLLHLHYFSIVASESRFKGNLRVDCTLHNFLLQMKFKEGFKISYLILILATSPDFEIQIHFESNL
jgi:hypothetical protein